MLDYLRGHLQTDFVTLNVIMTVTLIPLPLTLKQCIDTRCSLNTSHAHVANSLNTSVCLERHKNFCSLNILLNVTGQTP